MAKKKIIGIGVPAITAFIIATIKNICISQDVINDITHSFIHLLWFLKCLLLCYMTGFIFLKIFRSNACLAAIISGLLASIISQMGVVFFNFLLPFFWFGYLCKSYNKFILTHQKWILTICTTVYIVLLFGWNGRMTIYTTPITFWDWETYTIDINNLSIAIYRLIIGLSGSMMFFLISPYLWKNIKGSKLANIITNIGKSTLGIYWFQVFTLEIIFSKLNIGLSPNIAIVVAPLLAIFELILCYKLVTITRLFKITRFCILGEKYNQ